MLTCPKSTTQALVILGFVLSFIFGMVASTTLNKTNFDARQALLQHNNMLQQNVTDLFTYNQSLFNQLSSEQTTRASESVKARACHDKLFLIKQEFERIKKSLDEYKKSS